ncbi:ABC transporter ATP-binding protein [Rhodoplanes sp. Z2-YC6860]|uniref:ABC transporter ATP-binding protein n=1 Tax=Rhodoplanes sp. Z2-YC6860 TaxID=674703 RepID=UPI00078E95B9|nr:ABC transporter ATP-binding protein [Rhodoplanes sp. Z2-YC6860]AMN40429.1 NitT/TauT family transport system ATP-binding protein [Rhodoplanes sp. Z2-YC6860]
MNEGPGYREDRGSEAGRTIDTDSAFLRVESISKTYPARDKQPVEAIKDISFSLSKGEFASILGPSGCGKSTLLLIIAGLIAPTSGQMIFREPDSTSETDFGIVFQDPVLFPWRDVQANVELPGEIARLDREERSAKARQLIALVGLQGFERKYPYELSGGMQQRVSIARALMLSPSLLLMDEPFGALDAMTREQMNLELQKISLATGATVVFVTHSITEAAFLSDRVMVMTGRPATLKDVVTIDTPRPRGIDMIASGHFSDHVARLRRLLNARSDPT